MRLATAFAASLALPFILAACSDDDAAPIGAYTEEVRFTRAGNEAVLIVEVATDSTERRQGLMNRTAMPEDAGMLFVHQDDVETSFSMSNTTIPLSIAFITAGGTIIDIQDMEPLSEESHRSPQPYRYAVEANQGWFNSNGVRAGDLVQLPVGIGID